MFPLGLPAVDLRGFHGVLNSTTNVVLTEIERGLSFDEAVKRAQAMGIAETDPAADLDGWDAAFQGGGAGDCADGRAGKNRASAADRAFAS